MADNSSQTQTQTPAQPDYNTYLGQSGGGTNMDYSTQTAAPGVEGAFLGQRTGYDIAQANQAFNPNYASDRSAMAQGAAAVARRAKPQMQDFSTTGIYGRENDFNNTLSGNANGENLIGANTVGVDPSSRGTQAALAKMLMDASAGNGPSAADLQFQKNTNDALAQQLAIANSGNGVNPMIALKNAGAQQALISQNAANQAGQLKAQEQQTARAQLGDVSNMMRAGDINAAQLAAQQNQFNANLGVNQIQTARDQLGRNLNTMGNQVLQGNEANLQANLTGQGQNDAMVQFYQSQGLSLDQAMYMAQIQQNQFNAGQLNAGIANAHGLSVQSAAQGLQFTAGLVGGAGSAISGIGALAKSGGGEGDETASDKRLKKNVKKADKQTREFLNALSSKSFDYKNPDKHGQGNHLGVLAQDVAKSRMGREIIVSHNDGMYLDNRKALSASLAAAAHLNERMTKLENKSKKSKKKT